MEGGERGSEEREELGGQEELVGEVAGGTKEGEAEGLGQLEQLGGAARAGGVG